MNNSFDESNTFSEANKKIEIENVQSPLNDLSLPATFDKQTFEPPPLLQQVTTAANSETSFLQIMPDSPNCSMRGIASEELEAIIAALETQAVDASNRLRSCTDFELPYILKVSEIQVNTNWQFS